MSSKINLIFRMSRAIVSILVFIGSFILAMQGDYIKAFYLLALAGVLSLGEIESLLRDLIDVY